MSGGPGRPRRRPHRGPARLPQRRLDLHPPDLQRARQPADDLPPPGRRLRPPPLQGAGPRRRARRATRSPRWSTSPATPGTTSRGLYKLSLAAAHRRGTWQPALAQGEAPDAWTLALRFEGEPPRHRRPRQLRDRRRRQHLGRQQLRLRPPPRKSPPAAATSSSSFTPTGQTYPGSPYVGRRPQRGRLRHHDRPVQPRLARQLRLRRQGLRNRGRTTTPPRSSASAGKPLSPPGGWEVGGISWPQGTVTDQGGNIWLANCGNDSVTKIDATTRLTAAATAAVNFGEGR